MDICRKTRQNDRSIKMICRHSEKSARKGAEVCAREKESESAIEKVSPPPPLILLSGGILSCSAGEGGTSPFGMYNRSTPRRGYTQRKDASGFYFAQPPFKMKRSLVQKTSKEESGLMGAGHCSNE